MGSDYTGLSQCCAMYSAVGIIFMVWVGIMLMHQPFFVGGIDDVETAKSNAFGAAGTFFFTFLISIIYLIADAQFGFGRSGSVAGSVNSRNNRSSVRGEYDLVTAVQEYHDSPDDEHHELGEFT